MNRISISARVYRWLHITPLQERINRRMAALLQVILISCIVISAVSFFVSLVIAQHISWQTSLMRSTLAILINGMLLGLLRRGYYRGPVLILIAIFVSLEIYTVTTAVSLREIAATLSFFSLAILLAGLLVGRHALVTTFGLSAGTVAFSAYWEQKTGIGNQGVIIAGTFIVLNGLMSLILDWFGATLRTALKAAREREVALETEIHERQQTEAALRQSEERYRKLINNARDVVFTISNDGILTTLNPAFEIFTGWSRKEWIGRLFYELVAQADRVRAQEQFDRIIHGATLRALRLRLLTRLGEVLFVEMNISPQTEADQVVGLLGIARDMTQEQQAEDALREAEEKYRSIFENVVEGIHQTTPEGRYVVANPAEARMLGYESPAELIANVTDLKHNFYVDPNRHEQFKLALEQSDTVIGFESQVYCKNGSIIWISENGRAVRDEGSRLLYYEGTSENITERKQSEETIKESEDKYRRLVEHSPYGIVIHVQGRMVYINPQGLRLSGAEHAEEMLGKPVLDFVHPDSRPTVIQRLRELSADQEAPPLEEKFICLDGRVIDVEVSAYPFTYQNQPAVQVVFQDITERKRAEEKIQQQANEMTALYETTHDLVIGRDLSELLQIVVARAVGLVRASGGGLYLSEPEQSQIRCVVSYNTLYDHTGTVLKYGEGAAGLVAQTGEPLMIDDHRAWPGRVHEQDQPSGSVLSVPMRWQDRVIGVIHVLENAKVQAFTEQDLRIVTLFANQAAVAVENAKLLGALQDALKIQSRLFDAASAVTSQLDAETVLREIVKNVHKAVEADQSNVMLIDERGYCYRWIGTGYPDELQPHQVRRNGITRQVMQSEEAIFISAAQNSKTLNPHMLEAGIQATACLPLFGKSHAIGVMWVNFMRPHEFSRQEQAVLKAFTDHVSIAVEHATLFEVEQRRRQEAAAIVEVSRDISASLQLNIVLERIAFYAKDLLNVETSAVYLAEPTTPTLHAVAATGPDAEEIKHDSLEIGAGILGNIALQRLGEIVYDTATDPRGITIEGTAVTPLEHLMGVPVLSKDQLIGLIAVWRSGAGLEFKPTELDFLSSLAGQVAVAIENARLFEETQQRLHEMQGLSQIGEAISQTIELEPLLTQILDAICETIPAAEKGSILLVEGQEALRVYAISGYADPRTRAVRFSTEAGYASLAIRDKRGILVPDARMDVSIQYNEDIPEMHEIQSAMVAPLIVNQRVLGVISLDNASRKSAFTEDDLRLLLTLATPAALAIENAQLFKKTRQRLADLEILQTISTALRVARTLNEALPILLNKLIDLLEVGSALLDLLDPVSGEIVTELAYGTWAPVTGLRTPRNAGVSGHVLTTGQPYITTHMVADGLVSRPDLVGGLNAVACVPIIAQHQPIGVLWVGRDTPITAEEVSLLTALGEMMGNTIQRMSLREQTEHLLEDLKASNRELTEAYDTTLEGWAKALELRDRETEGHTRRVTELTLRLARYMGMSEIEMVNIQRGGLLHDIGKMGVPDHILKKTGPLTASEWVEMRQHPQHAYNMLAPIGYLRGALDIPYCHHEHWDGSGYPRGLKGDQIPVAARIFSVVDIWDALISDRTYRTAWPRHKVVQYLKENAGQILDPIAVSSFFEMIGEE